MNNLDKILQECKLKTAVDNNIVLKDNGHDDIIKSIPGFENSGVYNKIIDLYSEKVYTNSAMIKLGVDTYALLILNIDEHTPNKYTLAHCFLFLPNHSNSNKYFYRAKTGVVHITSSKYEFVGNRGYIDFSFRGLVEHPFSNSPYFKSQHLPDESRPLRVSDFIEKPSNEDMREWTYNHSFSSFKPAPDMYVKEDLIHQCWGDEFSISPYTFISYFEYLSMFINLFETINILVNEPNKYSDDLNVMIDRQSVVDEIYRDVLNECHILKYREFVLSNRSLYPKEPLPKLCDTNNI